MQLSASQFEQIITTLRSDGGSRNKERRKNPRVGVRSVLSIIPIADGRAGTPIKVSLRNVSNGGIGIVYTSPMLVGSQFVTRFLADLEQAEIIVICTVKNCCALGDEFHAIGASFVKQVQKVPKSNTAVASVPAKDAPVTQAADQKSDGPPSQKPQTAKETSAPATPAAATAEESKSSPSPAANQKQTAGV